MSDTVTEALAPPEAVSHTEPVGVPRTVRDTIADPDNYRLDPVVAVRDAHGDRHALVAEPEPDREHWSDDARWGVDLAAGLLLGERLGHTRGSDARTFAAGYATHAAVHRCAH